MIKLDLLIYGKSWKHYKALSMGLFNFQTTRNYPDKFSDNINGIDIRLDHRIVVNGIPEGLEGAILHVSLRNTISTRGSSVLQKDTLYKALKLATYKYIVFSEVGFGHIIESNLLVLERSPQTEQLKEEDAILNLTIYSKPIRERSVNVDMSLRTFMTSRHYDNISKDRLLGIDVHSDNYITVNGIPKGLEDKLVPVESFFLGEYRRALCLGKYHIVYNKENVGRLVLSSSIKGPDQMNVETDTTTAYDFISSKTGLNVDTVKKFVRGVLLTDTDCALDLAKELGLGFYQVHAIVTCFNKWTGFDKS